MNHELIATSEPKSDARQRLAIISWSVAAILAGFLCFTQLGMMLILLAGGVSAGVVAPAGWVLALWLGDRLAVRGGLAGRARLWPIGCACAALAGSLGVCAWYFDLSWDGQWYHQTAVYAIARGWNPLTEPMRAFLPHLELWVRHYAKGPWYVAAAIYDTTGRIELGKCTSLLAGAASFAATFAAGLNWNLSRRHATALALLVTLNPVWLSESTTYLVDGIMVGFLVVAVAAVFSTFHCSQPLVIAVGILASITAINAKFTGLVFLCFVFAAGWIWCAARHRDRLVRYTAYTALALVLGTVVWGYNPYVTNLVHRHQPFYPVLGSTAYPSLTAQGREGIIRYETPKNFLAHNRLVRLGYATFGRPGVAPYAGTRDATLMWPFTATRADLAYYHYHETRTAGFGPYFSAAWLLALALGAWLLLQRTPARWAAVLTVAAIAGSLLISPHLWWARYGPQFWLLPIVPIAFVFWLKPRRSALAAAWVLAGLLLVNTTIVGVVHLAWETRATQTLRRQLVELSQPGREIDISFRWFEIPVAERLKTWGVHFHARGRDEIRNGPELMSVVDRYPGAIHYRVVTSAPATPP